MRIAIAAALMLSLSQARAYSQPPSLVPSLVPSPTGGVISLDFRSTSVREVLTMIAGAGGVPISFGPGAGERTDRVFERITLTNVSPEAALRRAAEMAGLSVAAGGEGFVLATDPEAKALATKADQSLWSGAAWKQSAKPFVLALLLEQKVGEEQGQQEVAQEIQVGARDSFALSVRAGDVLYDVLYGVQGQTGSVAQGEDGSRFLPVRLRIVRRPRLGGPRLEMTRDLQVPLDETQAALAYASSKATAQAAAQAAAAQRLVSFAPTVSARDNADYVAPAGASPEAKPGAK